MRLLFVGGTRSGKSALAAQTAERLSEDRCLVATASAGDDEMRLRIERHRRERGPGWTVVEEPLHLAPVLRELDHEVVLVDGIGMWIANLMGDGVDGDQVVQMTRDLAEAVCARPRHTVLVSDEVGCGVVPASALGRSFRDCVGEANQILARCCDTVVLCAAGLPLALKGRLP